MKLDATENLRFAGRRSVVLASRAAVASSQPLATEAGLDVLRAGGSAADAAVAVAAALQVTQPCSTGLGGDAFCLYLAADEGIVGAYNGSGRAPRALTLDVAMSAAVDGALPPFHAHTVTVPGAADAWAAVQSRYGRLPMRRVLEPAISLAREGFSVAPMTARWWKSGAERQLSAVRYGSELLIDGIAPTVGRRFRNPGLASVLEELATDDPRVGRDRFYHGWIAERIVEEVTHEGGVMTTDDLAEHRGEWVDPISVAYGDYRVWECPPNGQGVAALIAIGVYAAFRRLNPGADRVTLMHAQVEAMRIGFADGAAHIADPAHTSVPVNELLDPVYAARRAASICPGSRMEAVGPGSAVGSVGRDTVYFCVVDADGNACSFINSNYTGFGTGIVPRGCGFTLQNRGRGFRLDPAHPNCIAPLKRPYHTIIPGLLTRGSGGKPPLDAAAVFGVMGGMMQPQGHLQVVASMVDDGVDPQSALDRPRWQLRDGDPEGVVLVEESMEDELIAGLEARGHTVERVSGPERAGFGLGQVIAFGEEGILLAGSDPRGDGQASGY